MYRVYPTERVKGYTHTYCMTEDAAWQTLMDMEEQTGVEWAIAAPEWARIKEKVINGLSNILNRMDDGEDAKKMVRIINTIDKYWAMED